MKTSKAQFRWLLAGYFFVVILSAIADLWGASTIPAVVKELEPNVSTYSRPLLILFLVVAVSIVASELVGFIGMFCFWSAARYIYLFAVLAKILGSPLLGSWMVHTGWESLFGEFEIFLDGVILTLCLVGPAQHLFTNKRKSNHRLHSIAGSARSE
jgi:hypothetical protein